MGLLDKSSLSSQALLNCFEVSKFVAKTKELLQNGSITADSGWIFRLCSQVEALDERFQSWDKLASIAVGTQKHHGSTTAPIVTKSLEDPYPTWISSFWNKSRGARILLHQKFMEASSTTQISDIYHETCKIRFLLTIHGLVKAILNSTPYALDFGPSLFDSSSPRSFGGYIFQWPLQVIMRCPYATQTDRIQARKSLETIGLECGLSYAAVYAQSFEL